MRFILNEFPDDLSFEPGEEWFPLRESTNLWIIQFQALPFLIVNVVLITLILHLIGITFHLSLYVMFTSFLLFIPVHELIHALYFPERLSSNNIFFGFTVNGFAPFVAFFGEMKRNTYIMVLLAPFIIITLLGYIYLLLFGTNSLVEHIIFFNAIGACADCLGVWIVLRQVPKHAVLRNKKIRTYWKIPAS